MKSKYWIILLVLVLTICLGASFFLMRSGEAATLAQIRSGGELIATVDLTVDQEFTVTAPDGGINIVTVQDGKIAVTFADCPDQYCVKQGFCNSGVQIVCLPHTLFISFVDDKGIDGAIG